MHLQEGGEGLEEQAAAYLVVELVVAAEHDETAPGHGQRIEHLLGRLPPDLRVGDAVVAGPGLGHEQLLDAVVSPVQGESVGGDGDEKDVGEGGAEVDDLAAGLDSLDEAAKDDDPGEEKAEGEVPLDGADIAGVREGVGDVPEGGLGGIIALDGLGRLRREGLVDDDDDYDDYDDDYDD